MSDNTLHCVRVGREMMNQGLIAVVWSDVFAHPVRGIEEDWHVEASGL